MLGLDNDALAEATEYVWSSERSADAVGNGPSITVGILLGYEGLHRGPRRNARHIRDLPIPLGRSKQTHSATVARCHLRDSISP